MEPNQNMENNNPFVGAPVSEQVVTEQVAETQMGPAPMEPAALPEKKKSNGMLIGLILCLVLAAGGIGFGAFAMIDGNSRAENLNKQISELKSTNNDLLDKLSETSKDDGDTIINIDTDTDADTEDYIYVGEWGLKIKIPSKLNYVSYKFMQHGGVGQTEGSSIGVSGTIGDVLSDFANLDENRDSLGFAYRVHKDAYSGSEYDGVSEDRKVCGVNGGLIFSSGDYNYCYEHPQVNYSLDEEDKKLEIESVNLIEEMLKNTENWSAI